MNNYRKTLYDIFSSKTSSNKDLLLNDIMKGTKSLLASKKRYHLYIKNYDSFTKYSTFKSPDITEYPIQKESSSFLIPLNYIKFKEKEKKPIFKRENLLLEADIFQKNKNNFLEDFNKRLMKTVKYNEQIKNKKSFSYLNFHKKTERYNSLFLDFFSKWRTNNKKINLRYFLAQEKMPEIKPKKENPFLNFNLKERYAGLHYDENEIFNANYDKFISNKLNYVKKNKIKNFTSEIKSAFLDSNEKKIILKLESIKLTFSARNKEQIGFKEFYIFIPLSYVFLFYSSDFAFFQKILMSLLKFETNYKTISFKDEGFIDLLNTLNNENQENENDKDEDEDILEDFNKGTIREKIKKYNNNTYKEELYEMRKTYDAKFHNANRFMRKSSKAFEDEKEEEMKTKIIHSNKKYNKIKNIDEERKEKINGNKMSNSDSNKHDILYNEYYFIWETSAVTYDVKMEMPKIYFCYQNLDYNIISFCEKNLFLYLYKNNFVNWDFYALNYLFSFKNFRKIISNFFSLNKTTNFMENSIFANLNDEMKIMPKFHKKYKITLDDNENNSDNEINGKKDVIISNKKILNQMNENNESFMFFYTDQNYDNYIINLYSYKIKIEHKKLNPKLNWEFILNFKQMKLLNEVSKYEDLLTFLPKIIVTNFEIGDLDINFNVFYNNFNAKILQNGEEEHHQTKKKKLKIEIFKPHIESEKIGARVNTRLEKELNNTLLQNLNRLKMANWSKKILALMKKDLLYKTYRASNIYTTKFQFSKKSPQREDIIGRLINKKTFKRKLTFFGGYKNKNINT